MRIRAQNVILYLKEFYISLRQIAADNLFKNEQRLAEKGDSLDLLTPATYNEYRNAGGTKGLFRSLLPARKEPCMEINFRETQPERRDKHAGVYIPHLDFWFKELMKNLTRCRAGHIRAAMGTRNSKL